MINLPKIIPTEQTTLAKPQTLLTQNTHLTSHKTHTYSYIDRYILSCVGEENKEAYDYYIIKLLLHSFIRGQRYNFFENPIEVLVQWSIFLPAPPWRITPVKGTRRGIQLGPAAMFLWGGLCKQLCFLLDLLCFGCLFTTTLLLLLVFQLLSHITSMVSQHRLVFLSLLSLSRIVNCNWISGFWLFF